MIRRTVNQVTLWAIQIIIAISAAISIVFGVLQPLISGLGWGRGPTFGRSIEINADLDRGPVIVLTEPALPTLQELTQGVQKGDGIEFSMPYGVDLLVNNVNLRQGLGLIGGQVLAGAVIVTSLILLFLIVNSFRQGDAFTPTNTRRLFSTALIVAVGGEIAALLFYWGTLEVLSTPRIAPFVIQEADLSFTPLLVGAGILLLAEVFRQGVNLQHEVDQTV